MKKSKRIFAIAIALVFAASALFIYIPRVFAVSNGPEGVVSYEFWRLDGFSDDASYFYAGDGEYMPYFPPLLSVPARGFFIPGETIAMVFSIENNPGFSSMAFRVDTPAGMQLRSVNYYFVEPYFGTSFAVNQADDMDGDPVFALWYGTRNFYGPERAPEYDGEPYRLFVLFFHILSTITLGELNIVGVEFANAVDLGEAGIIVDPDFEETPTAIDPITGDSVPSEIDIDDDASDEGFRVDFYWIPSISLDLTVDDVINGIATLDPFAFAPVTSVSIPVTVYNVPADMPIGTYDFGEPHDVTVMVDDHPHSFVFRIDVDIPDALLESVPAGFTLDVSGYVNVGSCADTGTPDCDCVDGEGRGHLIIELVPDSND